MNKNQALNYLRTMIGDTSHLDSIIVKYTKNNSKIRELGKMLKERGEIKYIRQVTAFDIPAGWTCPAADLCLARSDRKTGKITKGENAEFLCFAAKLEAVFSAVRRFRWSNFNAISKIKTSAEIAYVLISSMDEDVKVVRVHTSGDFYNNVYFRAWVLVAELLDDVSFFGYTKVLAYARYDKPSNMNFVYSVGGKHDSQVCESDVTSTVVCDRAHASELGIPVACNTPVSPDDYDYIMRRESFALIVH